MNNPTEFQALLKGYGYNLRLMADEINLIRSVTPGLCRISNITFSRLVDNVTGTGYKHVKLIDLI